ncbi:ferritin-like domain-containing protein [Cognatiluteimonas telluris]|jgi:bacterioferritin|uniref:ferritin-like domain-containing protein n=1 Tax=Cognatiluteimonas telluris TaxID=1104775 RepID=UPI00140810E4|nr:ferritin-like domain-containing protein [Lysobacter telluris]
MSKSEKKESKGGKQASPPLLPTAVSIPSARAPGTALTDVKTLRERARRDIDKGAITDSYTADRKEVVRLLNEALATEWVCVLRYYRHYFMAAGMLADSVKSEFLEHAQQELSHANRIAERIVQLGGEPDLDPETLTSRSHAEYKPGSDLRDMVKENLIAERIAIDSYREMILYIGDRDTTTKRILEAVLADEEEHADDMADLLDGWVG